MEVPFGPDTFSIGQQTKERRMARPQPERGPTLNLPQDGGTVRAFFARAAKRYARKHPDEPVTGIAVFFAMQNGFLDVYFWTQDDYEPFALDSRECRHAETLPVRHWQRYYEQSFEVPTQAVTPAGKILHTRPDDSDPDLPVCVGGDKVVAAVGAMLAGLLTAGLKDGTFAPLPKARTIKLAVQDDDDIVWWAR
jgi:hypothetical protein